LSETIPFDRVIWSAEKCAAYFEVSTDTFLKKTRHAKGFPAPLDMPGHPRWRASLVTAWAVGDLITLGSRETTLSR